MEKYKHLKGEKRVSLGYNEELNTRDLRTNPTTKDSLSFLVDQKLIDILLGQLIPTNLDKIKQALCDTIQQSENMDQMMKEVEDIFYIHKVSTKLREETAVEEEVVVENSVPVNNYALAE